jgi:cellulose synthase/poly-beta-1,6-N-acetylglucosamine synthase-like glycosyltransferase
MGAMAYNYLVYPVVLLICCAISQAKSDLGYLFRRKQRRCELLADSLPRVAVLVSAFNEESVIQMKANNCLQISYPADRLEFLFGLDAPTDSTAELLDQFRSDRFGVVHFNVRRGKLSVLCDLAKRTAADILVLTDANTMLDRNCIHNVVRHFRDAQVGAVTGEEIRTVAAGTDPGAESIYWRYESAIKILESRLNCTLGGNGAVLAVRRSLFQPTNRSIIEDFQIPLEIRFKGFRVVYDPEVIAIEDITPAFAAQFGRRVRIGAGNYQTLFHSLACLNPLKGMVAFCFFSHKVLRWLGPFLLFIAFCCSLALANKSAFAVITTAECTFVAMALTGYRLKKLGRSAGLAAIPFHFCSMNLALLMGFHAYVTGRQFLVWKATPRQPQSSGTILSASECDKGLVREPINELGRVA